MSRASFYKSDPVTYTQYEALAPLYCQKVSTDAIPQPTPRLRTDALDTMVFPQKSFPPGSPWGT